MTHNYLHARGKAADRNNLFSAGSFLTHTIRRGFAHQREDPLGPEAVPGLGLGKGMTLFLEDELGGEGGTTQLRLLQEG